MDYDNKQNSQRTSLLSLYFRMGVDNKIKYNAKVNYVIYYKVVNAMEKNKRKNKRVRSKFQY